MGDIDIEWVKSQVGSLRSVLERHDYDPRFGRTFCPNPQHNDRRPGSVWIYKATAGEERLKCHSCGFNGDAIDVARVLGEVIPWRRDFDPHRQGSRAAVVEEPKLTRKQHRKKQRLINEFQDDPTIEKDWILAKKLAVLGNLQAVQQEVLRNWDYLSENYNLPRAYELCQRIWEYGAEKFGLPHDQDFRHWVDRVAVALER